jgi:3-phosphoshikimate 1-carboxyvinyltransferase
LTAALALAHGDYVLAGVPRMHERPIGDLVDALRQAGARIEYRGREGFPPLAIAPREHAGARTVRVRGDVSSQYLTALLIAMGAGGDAALIEVEGSLISKPYVELTLAQMKKFGVDVKRDQWRAFEIPAGSRYASPGTVNVEGDASSASYFLGAGLLGRGPLRIDGVGRDSTQGDVRFAEVIKGMGGSVQMGDDWMKARGTGVVRAFDMDFNAIPDAAMTAAVLALFADGPSRLRNIASWRVKETDRIAAMATELRKFGAKVEEGADSLAIDPPPAFRTPLSRLAPVAIDTYEDHRMAMCFSLASFGPHPVRINDPGCVSKTFPTYFTEFARLVS